MKAQQRKNKRIEEGSTFLRKKKKKGCGEIRWTRQQRKRRLLLKEKEIKTAAEKLLKMWRQLEDRKTGPK